MTVSNTSCTAQGGSGGVLDHLTDTGSRSDGAVTPVSEVALLPCPFCYGEASFNIVRYGEKAVAEQGWYQDEFHGVNCIICGVNNIGIRGHDTKDEAAEAWNTRASQPASSQARIRELESALEAIIDTDTTVSGGGKVHDHGWCAEIAIAALSRKDVP